MTDDAPRITYNDILAEIVREQYHVFPDTTLTVCAITLANGYVVTGESASASPENFDPKIGRNVAREHAINKVWPLLGFRLRDRLTAT